MKEVVYHFAHLCKNVSCIPLLRREIVNIISIQEKCSLGIVFDQNKRLKYNPSIEGYFRIFTFEEDIFNLFSYFQKHA